MSRSVVRNDNIRSRPWLLVVLSALVLGLGAQFRGASALEVEFSTRAVNRDILAIYDARHEATPAVSRIHRLAEMPLNWLGYKITYRDVNAPLPSASELKRYSGIITWLVEPLDGAEAYLKWLDTATAAGARLACLSDLAPSEGSLRHETAQRVLERIGLKDADQFVNVTIAAKPLTTDAEMIGFERPLDSLLPPFPVFQPSSAATRVYLSVSVPDIEGVPSSALVVTSPGGGFAADAFTIFYDATADRVRWILNPFLFFRRAFGDERFPVPDVTTLAGRRIYFSHIDGDGWNNISEIEGYREAQVSAAEVIRREVIEPYGDLPVSVGLIAGDVDEDLAGITDAAQIAAKIFALPQVEVASHTYTHPFAWGFYENYDRGAELAMVEAAAHPVLSIMDRVRGLIYRVAGGNENAQTRDHYTAGAADLPRGYLKEPFDIEKEVKGALEISGHLAPKGKKAALYLWSGDTEPFEAAIRATREAGVRNMNGGDSRLDGEYPSVFYVPPIARPVGSERQIYAGNSNENTYTNNWHGTYYGQKMLIGTLKNTEAPRRLKPFNLYYHMYSGEKAGALSALKDNLAFARSEQVIPVKASTYAAIADDYFAVGLAQVDALSWTVSNRGSLQTFRFDDADAVDIDLGRSDGVLGATRANGALYIALDPAVGEAHITLKRVGGETVAADRQIVRLQDSRWQVRALQRQERCGFSFEAEGYGKGDMNWWTAPGRRFDVTVRSGAVLLESLGAAADASGRLSLSLGPNAIEGVAIDLVCHES